MNDSVTDCIHFLNTAQDPVLRVHQDGQDCLDGLFVVPCRQVSTHEFLLTGSHVFQTGGT